MIDWPSVVEESDIATKKKIELISYIYKIEAEATAFRKLRQTQKEPVNER